MVDLWEEEEESSEGEQIRIDKNVTNGGSHSLHSELSSPSNHPSPLCSASPASNILLPLLQEISPIPSQFGSCTQLPVEHSPSELNTAGDLEILLHVSTPIVENDEMPPTVPLEPGAFQPPPSLETAKQAYVDIKNLINPPCDTGSGYKDPGLDLVL